MKNRLDDPCVFKYHFTNITLGMRAKISIAFLSISLIASFGLASNQAFAGGFTSCAQCEQFRTSCLAQGIDDPVDCNRIADQCLKDLMCSAVGGEFIGIDTVSVLAAGAQYTAAWMIPVLVSAIGIGIVIVRKF